LPAYSTSKSAVLTLSECLRAELSTAGIAVVAVCPGFVDTNITTAARFAGVDAQEQERRRSAATRAFRRRGYSPERAARRILRAVDDNKAIAPVTAEARAGLVLSRLTPALVRAAARLDIAPR
jgi:NAD(P)-dependent dehydrogenase (short-subunit alcohol dehydrogenase family)